MTSAGGIGLAADCGASVIGPQNGRQVGWFAGLYPLTIWFAPTFQDFHENTRGDFFARQPTVFAGKIRSWFFVLQSRLPAPTFVQFRQLFNAGYDEVVNKKGGAPLLHFHPRDGGRGEHQDNKSGGQNTHGRNYERIGPVFPGMKEVTP